MYNPNFPYDRYMGFTWNGKNSVKEFGLFITNEAEELKFTNAPSFSNDYVNPLYQNRSYFVGTSVERRSLTLNLAITETTLEEYRKVIKWLDIYSTGLFFFDYDKNYGYFAKIASITDGTKHILESSVNGDTYLVTFSITFETVSDFLGISRYTTIVPLFEYNENTDETIILNNPTNGNDISIFGDNETEVFINQTASYQGEGLISDRKWVDFEIFNRGSETTSLKLDFAYGSGIIQLVEVLNSGEEREWFLLSLNLPEGETIGFSYNSETGAIISNGELIDMLIIQGDYAVANKFAKANMLIQSKEEETTKFRLYWTENLEAVLSFNKKTQII